MGQEHELYFTQTRTSHYPLPCSLVGLLKDVATSTGSSKKIPAKFSDTCSVRAAGLCIGCLHQWAERWRDNSNMQEFFRTTLYRDRSRASDVWHLGNMRREFGHLPFLNPIYIFARKHGDHLTLPPNISRFCVAINPSIIAAADCSGTHLIT